MKALMKGKKRQAETLPLNRDRVSGPSFSVFGDGGGGGGLQTAYVTSL